MTFKCGPAFGTRMEDLTDCLSQVRRSFKVSQLLDDWDRAMAGIEDMKFSEFARSE
jgi:hypothetical protein